MSENYNGCYKHASEIVLEATAKYPKVFVLKDGVSEKLLEVCDAVDEFVVSLGEECNCVDVSVDVYRKCMVIDVLCEDIVLEDCRNDPFFDVIKLACSFSFSKTKNDGLCIAFNIDSLWT